MDFTKIVKLYNKEKSIRTVSRCVGMSEGKVRKILITAGLLHYTRTNEAVERMADGESIEQIAASWGVRPNVVNNYLPYTKGEYDKNIDLAKEK